MAVLSLSAGSEASSSEVSVQPHPLRPVFVTVLAAKVVVAAFLLTTVSMAPPVSAETSYFASLN